MGVGVATDGGARATVGHLGVGLRRLFTGRLTVLALLALGWVLLAPEVATWLPYGDRPEPNAVQFAVTAVGPAFLTGLYLWSSASRVGDRPGWFPLTCAYNSLIVVIKFILSPAAFRNTPTTTLGEFVRVGLVAMVFYVIGLVAVYTAAQRHRPPRPSWTWPSKLALVAVLIVLAVVARWVAAVVLGAGAEEYFRHVYRGLGLLLPLFVGATAFLAVEAFDRAANPGAALQDGFAFVLIYHGLWVVTMVRMF
jgi:hypothetical protein